MGDQTTGWSEDGQWFWDGTQWHEAISPDGRYIYNGSQWEPFGGTRSAMPAHAFVPAASSPAEELAAPAGQAAPAEEYPAWMDPGEIARLKAEKEGRRANARQAPGKLEPVNWEQVHEGGKGRSGGLERMSRVLLLVVLFWSLVIVLALIGVFIYLPGHPLTRAR